MLTAIWALVIFTGVLTAAMGFYVYPGKSSEEQTKAVGKSAEDIRFRNIEEHLSLQKKISGN